MQTTHTLNHANSGTAAGFKRLAILSAIILSPLVCPVNQARAGTVSFQFTSIDIPGGIYPGGSGINNSGAIVGNYGQSAHPNVAPGFILRAGVVTDVVIPPEIIAAPNPDDFMWAGALNGVNDAGLAAGIYGDFNAQVHGFLRTPQGQIIYVPDAPILGSQPWTVFGRLNNRGVIAGWTTPNGWNPPISPLHAFTLSNGEYSLFDFPGSPATQAWGINDRNEVVGTYLDTAGVWHGYVRQGDMFKTFDFPGATATFPNSINNRGQIVGAYVDANRQQHGFLLSDGEFTTVDFPGAVNNDVTDINEHGQLVGNYNNYTGAYVATIVRER